MNTSGEVADLMVKEGIQVTESAAKLVGLGAKNLAAIIIALINDDTKLQGKTNLKQLLKSDKPLCILQIKEQDLRTFNAEAKKYGVLFTAVSDKTNNTGFCDIIAKQEDVTKLNYIMEKLGYTAPEIEPELEQTEHAEKTAEDKSKNQSPRVKENQQENESMRRGDTERTDSGTKPSVRKKIEEIKAEQAQKKKAVSEKEKSMQHTPSQNKKRKKKQKGRG